MAGSDRMRDGDAWSRVFRPHRRGLDPTVRWALGLFLVGFPLMLVFLVVTSWVAPWFAIDLATASPAQLARLNTAYVAAASTPFLVSAYLGLRAWRRDRFVAGLVVAILALVTVVAFVALPLVAGL